MGGDVVVLAEIGLDRGKQFLLRHFGLLEGLAGEGLLVEQDLAPRDLVDPFLVDLELAQGLGDLDRVAAGSEIGRRALQHRHMRRIFGQRRDQRRGGGAGADHDDALALVVEIFGPFLRMHDRALELRHILPLGRIALGVPVIALAHPEEIGGEAKLLAGVGADRVDGPEIALARPFCGMDRVLVADAAAEVIFRDDLAHVFQDLRGGRDRRRGPRLETVPERVKVAVGADAGIAMGRPGAAIGLLGFQHDEAGARALRGQMVGGADAGDAGAHHQNVEVFRGDGLGRANLRLNVHLPALFLVVATSAKRRHRSRGASSIP